MNEITPEEEKEPEGKHLVTILYSLSRDVYRVPSMGGQCWLSVKIYDQSVVPYSPDTIYLGPVLTVSGQGWRKSYSLGWHTIIQGDHAAVPEDDPMVVDYAAAVQKPEEAKREP